MDSEQFREFGKAAIDMIADYVDNIRDRQVLPSVDPGYLINYSPKDAPEEPEHWQTVLKDFNESVMPGVTHWQSPQFHAYFPTGVSYASLIGDLLASSIGSVGLTWAANPVCTELEVVTMNWLGKLLGLPEEFLNCSSGPGGGVIQGSASESTLVGLLVSKNKMILQTKEKFPDLDESQISLKLVAYTSDQSNSSVEKAGLLGSMKIRQLKTDRNGQLHGDTLKNAFEDDKAKGLIPCYVVATLGTTGTCAFDPLYELGPVCQEEGVWLHVDAAYAGAAFICPEYRYLMKGVEYVDSFNFNPHKWLLVNFDCSAMWVKNSYDVINAFDVQRIYLKNVENTKIPDYRHWQISLGRKFRSLKLWFVLKIYGAEGLRKYIRYQISLAQHFAKLVELDKRFIIEPKPSMGLVCFRLVHGTKLTEKLLENLTKRKEVFMVPGSYQGRYIIRFVVCSRLTTEEDVETSWNMIKQEADRLIGSDKVHTKTQSFATIDNLKSISLNEKSQ